LFLFLYPYLEGPRWGEWFFAGFFIVIPAAGVYAVSYERGLLVTGIVLGVPAVMWALELLFGIHLVPVGLGRVLSLVFYLYTTLAVLTFILTAEKVTSDILYGAVCVYLMMGMTWMIAYYHMEQAHPGSFLIGGGADPARIHQISDLLYYSFVTLTTLGYGDILPLTSQARSLAFLEATSGALYLAILIARLVSLYTTAEK
ncbi:MAG: ion channel, partial [bacterium]